MRSAVKTMVEVQVPFPVADVEDFWKRHKAEELTGETMEYEHMFGLGKDFGKVIVEHVTPVRITYKGQEAIIPEPKYRHWWVCWKMFGANGSQWRSIKTGQNDKLDT